jgi:hypothetical protein
MISVMEFFQSLELVIRLCAEFCVMFAAVTYIALHTP